MAIPSRETNERELPCGEPRGREAAGEAGVRPLPPGFTATRNTIRRWIGGRASKGGIAHLRDELLSATDLAIVLALQAWRPERGPFEPFAFQYAKRDTLRLLDRERRERTLYHDLGLLRTQALSNGDTAPDSRVDLQALTASFNGDPALETGLSHFVGGLSLRELSRRRRCSLRQVRTQVHRFVRAFADRLESHSLET